MYVCGTAELTEFDVPTHILKNIEAKKIFMSSEVAFIEDFEHNFLVLGLNNCSQLCFPADESDTFENGIWYQKMPRKIEFEANSISFVSTSVNHVVMKLTNKSVVGCGHLFNNSTELI